MSGVLCVFFGGYFGLFFELLFFDLQLYFERCDFDCGEGDENLDLVLYVMFFFSVGC